MRLRKKLDNLSALVIDTTTSIEEALKILIGRTELISFLKDEMDNLRKEKKELLDRLMSRGFEEYKTYSSEIDFKLGEELKKEEDEANAGEVFSVTDGD